MPGRRDGDGDTVVAERRPGKSESVPKSPKPVPEKYRRQAQAVAKAKPKAKRRRSGSRRKNNDLKAGPGKLPGMRVIRR